MERLRQYLIRQSKTFDSTSPARVPVLLKSKPVSTASTLYIRGAQIVEKYEEYITPIEVEVLPIKVK